MGSYVSLPRPATGIARCRGARRIRFGVRQDGRGRLSSGRWVSRWISGVSPSVGRERRSCVVSGSWLAQGSDVVEHGRQFVSGQLEI